MGKREKKIGKIGEWVTVRLPDDSVYEGNKEMKCRKMKKKERNKVSISLSLDLLLLCVRMEEKTR